jgi:hypothetical protein
MGQQLFSVEIPSMNEQVFVCLLSYDIFKIDFDCISIVSSSMTPYLNLSTPFTIA